MRERSSSSEISSPRGDVIDSDSDMSDDGQYYGKGGYPKGSGKGRGRPQSYTPSPCPRSLSDSLMWQGRGLTAPPATLLTLDCRSLRQTASLPAVLRAPEREREPERRISKSQARLIIPRTVSEYFELCRYSRSHTEGLLFSSSKLSGAFVGCNDLAGKALSEGLLGGHMLPKIGEDSRSAEGPPKPAAPPRPVPVEELKEGAIMEGKIVELANIGFFVDVGATQPGLLRHRHCQNCPERLLQEGQVLSNLVVISVDKKRRRFALALHGIDGAHLQEEAYDIVLERIAGWAGVAIAQPTLEQACTFAIGDSVIVTTDEEQLRMSFESICHKFDIAMLDILGTKQQVIDVRGEGSIIGLKEVTPNSGKPIWYYSASVFTSQAARQTLAKGDASIGGRGKGQQRRGQGRGDAATKRDNQRTETPRAGKGKQWQRRDKESADTNSGKAATSSKGKNGHSKGRGKRYVTNGYASNAWDSNGWYGGSSWWEW